uniref:Uncharacterized protein n=1 Tax=Glossina morsitans morsitans TaxID=37546 RepID=A0A1B0FGV4_GLOMM
MNDNLFMFNFMMTTEDDDDDGDDDNDDDDDDDDDDDGDDDDGYPLLKQQRLQQHQHQQQQQQRNILRINKNFNKFVRKNNEKTLERLPISSRYLTQDKSMHSGRHFNGYESINNGLPIFDPMPGRESVKGAERPLIFISNDFNARKLLNSMLSKWKYRMNEPVPGQILYPPRILQLKSKKRTNSPSKKTKPFVANGEKRINVMPFTIDDAKTYKAYYARQQVMWQPLINYVTKAKTKASSVKQLSTRKYEEKPKEENRTWFIINGR